MLFLNPWLLAGLVGATIPIIIHLVRQQAAKPVEWGAMRFLFDTISVRRRKMEWEDLLLMAARCLLLALLALALARPFIPPDSNIPWLFVLPAGLIGIALFGVGVGASLVALFSNFMVVPDFATTLGAMLGLAVGIDYALFIVSRYRSELNLGGTREAAAGRAVGTAGSSVVFAGLTVVVALAALAGCAAGCPVCDVCYAAGLARRAAGGSDDRADNR